MLEEIHDNSVRMKVLEVNYRNKIYDLEDKLDHTKQNLFYTKLILILTLFIFIGSMIIMNNDKEAMIKCIKSGNSENYCRALIERD